MRIREIITEDIQAMQEINRISQHIVNYFNQHPELVKSGVRVPLDKIVPNILADKTLNTMRLAVDIVIKPLASFEGINGRWELADMPGGTYSSQFRDPVTGVESPGIVDPETKKVGPNTADTWARSDRAGTTNGKIGYEIGMGNKLSVHLPAEVLTRSLDKNAPAVANYSKLQKTLNRPFYQNILSTLSHELNHAYNSLQGMDLQRTRKEIEANRVAGRDSDNWKKLIANSEDETTLRDLQRKLNTQGTPKEVREFWEKSIELLNSRKHFQELERGQSEWTEKVNNSTGEEAVKNKKILDDITARLEEEKTKIKELQAQKKSLANIIKKLRYDPNKPSAYDKDAYWTSPGEINSRLQEASLKIAKEIKPGMSNQAINDLIMRSFEEFQITAEFMDPSRMPKTFAAPPKIIDRDFRNLLSDRLKANNPSDLQFKQEAFNSALSRPEFKRLVSIAYKFIQAEQANPRLLSTPPATMGQRLKALFLNIPQDKIGDTILPSGKDVATDAARQVFAPKDPRMQKIVADTINASKKLDTPGAIKALEVGGKVLMAAGVVVEIYRGFDQISALPDTLPDAQYRQEVEKIVVKLVAEFGLVYVAAIAGSWLAGVAASVLLPGLGTVAGAVVGFVAGGAAGYYALEFAGDSVRSIVDKIVMSRNKRGWDSMADYSPILERIIELAAIKKPT